MQTTIKNLRKMLDAGQITIADIKGVSVKVGFLTLQVAGYELTPGDYMPNVWILTRAGKRYRFTPYNGLEEI